MAVRARYVMVPVWDRVLRLLHWWMALALLAQFVTGASFVVWGGQMSNALMGKIDFVHYCGGYAFAAGLVLRVIWLFVGPPNARWRDLLPLEVEQRRVWRETLLCYCSLFRRRVSTWRGHNAFAGIGYIGFFCVAAVQVVLGIILSLMRGSRAMKSPLMVVHECGFFLLLAFVVVHVAAVVVHEVTGHGGLISAMVHGRKTYSEGEYQALEAVPDEGGPDEGGPDEGVPVLGEGRE